MRAHGLAALSAGLYVAAYPAGLDLGPLALCALVPLLVALRTLRVRRAAAVGLTFGVLTQLAGHTFMPETLLRFSGLPWIVCLLLYALLALAQGTASAAFCALHAAVRTRLGANAPTLLSAPPLWVMVELTFPTLFPSPLAAAAHDLPTLLQAAEFGGAALVSLGIATMNAALADAIVALQQRARVLAAVACAAAALLLALWGLCAVRMAHIEDVSARAPTLRVALVQAGLFATEKRRDPNAYAHRYAELSWDIAAPHDLVIWPESALATAIPRALTRRSQSHAALARLERPLLLGAVTYQAGRLYNSALLFDARGRKIGQSDKRELLPFAEYLPLGERFEQLYSLVPGAGRFTAGDRAPALALGPARIAAFICYEDMLGQPVRTASQHARANLLVSLSNDAWFDDGRGRNRAAYTHLAVAKLRAVELRKTLVRATNTGFTAVIGPSGRVHGGLAERVSAVLLASAPLLDHDTSFARWGNAPTAGLCALWLLLALLATGVTSRSESASATAA